MHCFQAAVVGSSVWIQKWSDDADKISTAEFRSQTGLKMGVYAGFGCLQGSKLIFYKSSHVYILKGIV